MPSLEVEEASVSETPETESADAEEMVMIVVEALKTESDEGRREEMLRSIEDTGLIAGISEELYGEDDVRELLIKEVCRKKGERESGSGDVKAESKAVSVENFKKAFDELERGRIYVSVPQLRKKLAWPHEVFDDMIYKLRNDETIILHVTEAGKYDPEEFFYDEDNERMGMVTWKKSA